MYLHPDIFVSTSVFRYIDILQIYLYIYIRISIYRYSRYICIYICISISTISIFLYPDVHYKNRSKTLYHSTLIYKQIVFVVVVGVIIVVIQKLSDGYVKKGF